jgi:hypothetical protein
MRVIRLGLMACIVLLTACVTPQLKISPADAAKRGQSDIVLTLPADGMRAQFLTSTGGTTGGGAFGLVGLLVGTVVDASVNSSRANDAKVGFDQYQNALEAYRFGEKAKAIIESRLAVVKAERINPVVAKSDIVKIGLDSVGQAEFSVVPGAVRKVFGESKADSVIVIGMENSMTPGRDFLQINAVAMIVRRGESEGSYLHRWQYIESYAPPDELGSLDQRWLANRGAILHKGLDEVLTNVTRKIIADLFPSFVALESAK